ncbi:MAG: helix-turn-helix domain-containing protein [Pseudomonadota bacterium]
MTNCKHPKDKGAAAETNHPKHTSLKPKFTDNSAHNQRLKLLDWFFEHGSISSYTAQEKLDVYHPPARIFELRKAGYQIATIWDNWTSEYGIKHRIARYVLTHKQPLEPIADSGVVI